MTLPRSAIRAQFGKGQSGQGGVEPPANAVFRFLHDSALVTHGLATMLLDSPRGWKARDELRLQVARELLQESAQWSGLALDYAVKNAARLGPDAEAGGGESRPLRDLFEVLQHTGALWSNLLDIQARLGQRQRAEIIAADYTQLVERVVGGPPAEAAAAAGAKAGGDGSKPLPAQLVQHPLRDSTRQIILFKHAQLLAVRGEWAECVGKHVALLRGMVEPYMFAPPPSPSAAPVLANGEEQPRLPPGHDMEMAAEFAALSHARMQLAATAAASSAAAAAARAAVVDAQHGVALLTPRAELPLLSEVRAALDGEAKVGPTAGAAVRIGDVPYDELLSPAVLARARPVYHELLTSHPVADFGGLLQSPAVPHMRALTRLSQRAAVYQQLGLALRAAGRTEEAQRAFDFADEIAAMRPGAPEQRG
jgi:hypothetical protein